MFKRIMSLCCSVISIAVIFTILYMINHDDYTKHQEIYLAFNIVSLAAFFYLLVKYKVITVKFPSFRLFLEALGWAFIGIALTIVLTLLGGEDSSSSSSDALEAFGKMGLPLSLIIDITLFAPIREELIFRGLMQHGGFNNSWLGIIIVSSVFSIFHGPYDVLSFLNYASAGLIMGYAYQKSDNFYLPILIHIINNSVAVLLITLEHTGVFS